jgi:hypothetical protein
LVPKSHEFNNTLISLAIDHNKELTLEEDRFNNYLLTMELPYYNYSVNSKQINTLRFIQIFNISKLNANKAIILLGTILENIGYL